MTNKITIMENLINDLYRTLDLSHIRLTYSGSMCRYISKALCDLEFMEDVDDIVRLSTFATKLSNIQNDDIRKYFKLPYNLVYNCIKTNYLNPKFNKSLYSFSDIDNIAIYAHDITVPQNIKKLMDHKHYIRRIAFMSSERSFILNLESSVRRWISIPFYARKDILNIILKTTRADIVVYTVDTEHVKSIMSDINSMRKPLMFIDIEQFMTEDNLRTAIFEKNHYIRMNYYRR